MESINIGDKVKFNARGREHRGTVTDVKFSRPGSRSRNMLVQLYGMETPTHRKLVVMPEGGGGVWTVPETMCTKVGVDTDVRSSINKAHEITSHIKHQRAERNAQGMDKAHDAGLLGLVKGDAIEVQLRNRGWTPAKFSHVTNSGRVGFTLPHRTGQLNWDGQVIPTAVYFSHAQFVRIPAAPAT
jgi:hypothetical protein